VWSPDELEREGFTLKAMISGGRYRYTSGALNNAWVTGTDENLRLLPGWRFTRDRFEAKIFVGLDAKHGATSPDDPDNRLHGTHVGMRTAVDVWYEPTPSTMLAAAIASSARRPRDRVENRAMGMVGGGRLVR
jgi:outer membrane receptor protein involved in Fe transport